MKEEREENENLHPRRSSLFHEELFQDRGQQALVEIITKKICVREKKVLLTNGGTTIKVGGFRRKVLTKSWFSTKSKAILD